MRRTELLQHAFLHTARAWALLRAIPKGDHGQADPDFAELEMIESNLWTIHNDLELLAQRSHREEVGLMAELFHGRTAGEKG